MTYYFIITIYYLLPTTYYLHTIYSLLITTATSYKTTTTTTHYLLSTTYHLKTPTEIPCLLFSYTLVRVVRGHTPVVSTFFRGHQTVQSVFCWLHTLINNCRGTTSSTNQLLNICVCYRVRMLVRLVGGMGAFFNKTCVVQFDKETMCGYDLHIQLNKSVGKFDAIVKVEHPLGHHHHCSFLYFLD